MADNGSQENSADGSETIGLPENSERPKRTAPTLDLDAVEIPSGAPNAEVNQERAEPVRRPKAGIATAALVSTIFGGSAAALVVAAASWTGWLTPRPAVPPPPAPINTAATDALAARVAKIESRVNSPQASVPDPATVARSEATEKSLETMRTELAAARAQSEKLAAAIDEIKSAPRETPPAPPEAPPSPPVDLSPINERIAQLERSIKAVTAEAAKPVAPSRADDLPLRRIVAATLLNMAVRQGEPYAAALAAAKPFAPTADALKPLEPFAASGLPSANAMSRELLAIVAKLSSPAQDHAPESVVERLQAGAARLVRIERTDAAIGNDRKAIVARITAAALRNDVGEARRELNTLAPADRAAAQSWIDKADARDAALAASRQFAADGMAALTKPAP